jgi:RHH-type proline utilization regulon transcriptional repressor/proline dehydrogenase/delta 1-pyrroline-5-carboxylate dehydrogenase
VARTVATFARLPGPIVSVHAARTDEPLAYQTDWLLEEVSTSINTTAAGGNASLMMIS